MTGHTKGPWGVWNGTDVFSAHADDLHDGDGWHIADCNVHDYGFSNLPDLSSETKRANARLIAAAPELLEALIEMIEHFERVDGDERHKAVISKASRAYGRATGADQ